MWSLAEVKALLKETGERAGIPCEDVPVTISTKMVKTMGTFYFKIKEGKLLPHEFRFAEVLLSGRYEEKVVREVILHEYAHFYANVKDQVNHHHDEVFKETCVKLGIGSHTYFKELVPQVKKKGYLLYCSSCKKEVARRRRVDIVGRILRGKVSSCCQAKLLAKGGIF